MAYEKGNRMVTRMSLGWRRYPTYLQGRVIFFYHGNYLPDLGMSLLVELAFLSCTCDCQLELNFNKANVSMVFTDGI